MMKTYKTVFFAALIAVGAAIYNAPAWSINELSTIAQKLNSIKTAKGRFKQLNPNGAVITGDYYLSRPGKMRFVYDPPNHIVLLSDGHWAMQLDTKMQSSMHKRLKSTPLYFLLRDNVSFDDGVEIINHENNGHMIKITLAQKGQRNKGSVIMEFDANNHDIKSWTIIDPKRGNIKVLLTSMERGIPLDKNLFKKPKGW